MTTSPDIVTPPQVLSFLQGLRQDLHDPRDNRGKRHSVEFTLVGVAIALMSHCQSLSSIPRFICNRLAWLRELTGMPQAAALSRAYLPRFLDRMSWSALGQLMAHHFSVGAGPSAWVAIDGKALRGSCRGEQREAVVLAVAHGSGEDLARALQSGPKTSEVAVVRDLLHQAKLAGRKVTLDALHCNPGTLGLIARAQGTYLVQVKGNQPELLQQCGALAACEPVQAKLTQTDKGHGRITTRTCQLLPLRGNSLDPRWTACQLRYLVTVHRTVHTLATGVTSIELSYYVTNAASAGTLAHRLAELASAIRGHWGVESNNWVRDVTLGEDRVRIRAPNQAHVLALLRSLALNLLRRAGGQNLQATIERFSAVPSALADWLKQMRVL